MKNSNVSNKTLTCLITCYGKTNEEVKRALKSIKSEIRKKIDIIFIYKNGENFNYDWVKNEKWLSAVYEVKDKSWKRIEKVLYSSTNLIKTKYFFILDPDDSISNVEPFINWLEKGKDTFKYISNRFILSQDEKLISNSCLFHASSTPTSIYNTKVISSLSKNFNEKTMKMLVPDDVIMMLEMIKQQKITKLSDIVFLDLPFYKYNNETTTSVQKMYSISKSHMNKFIDDLCLLFAVYSKWDIEGLIVCGLQYIKWIKQRIYESDSLSNREKRKLFKKTLVVFRKFNIFSIVEHNWKL